MRSPRPARRRVALQAVAIGALSTTLWLVGCADQTPKPAANPPKAAGPRPQDDMYRAVNGAWLATTEIPPDRSSWGAFLQLRDEAVTQLKTVIDEASTAGANGTADQKKIVALYESFMDEERLNALGAKPIAPQMKAIDAIKSKRDLPAVIAQFNEVGIGAPYFVYIGQDAKDPTHYIPTIAQGGLGLPDRDYYLSDDAKLKEARDKYVVHVAKMLSLAGVADADAAARAVLDLETRLARVQWTRVQNRDPVKTYNKVALANLDALTPGYGWKPWLTTAHVSGKVNSVIVAQPSYLKGFAATVDAVPLDTWKAYFKYRVVSSTAPYLSKPFVDEDFAFEGRVLSGTPEDLPRWKKGVGTVEAAIGQGLGKLYVARWFPPENKARMDDMVRNILAAYKQSIDGLDWMGPDTKREAQAKLAKFDPKIAYPSKWRDYTALTIRKDDLIGNVMRARRFEYDRNNAKLGKPIDRTEWGMTPQTVNAYYNREPQRDRLPGRHPAAAVLRCEGRRRHQLRLDRRGDRPRDQPWLRRCRQPGRRRRTPAQLVDRRGPPALRREDEGAGRAVRRVRAGARLSRQRRVDARREHRRQLGPLDRVQGISDLAARPAVAGDRREDRRAALLRRLRDDLAQQGPRRAGHPARQVRSALAGRIPRERDAAQPGAVLRGVRGQAGRRDVSAARAARDDLVTAVAVERGQAIVSTTPPSTRSAAPVVADACVEQT